MHYNVAMCLSCGANVEVDNPDCEPISGLGWLCPQCGDGRPDLGSCADAVLVEPICQGGGIFPPQKHGDVGYDIAVVGNATVYSHRTSLLSTGVKVKVPDDTWGLLTGRSSATKRGLFVVPAVIDPGYTGELLVPVRCVGNGTSQDISGGTRLAQLVLIPKVVRRIAIGKMPTTERGNTGFGSTGQ